MSRPGQRIQVPDDLREVLLEFTISYLLEQPGDVVEFAAEYFSRLRESRTTALLYEGAAISPDEESTMSREEEVIDLSVMLMLCEIYKALTFY
ncbi:hypothetical protein HHI36_003060 [Cryptolaemus montrouzieri]|uniref:RIIa domain-containing protein n=1 Tax=Cryptolaemus montrouzieri TaxID=559131 RepID=A0ABD2PCU4_9CUCU